MHVLSFTFLCKVLILTTLLISQSKAETATSGNLLPNAGDGASGMQHSNSTLDKTGSGSGFNIEGGITSWANELEAQGTGTVSATGSLVDITTTTQSGNSHTTTTTSLDGGVTLNATTEVQNCEWSGSSYQCGNATNGRDTFTTTIKILDENESVLASTSINRNNDAGYYNNTYTYTDTITHNDTGARKWDWEWQGVNTNNIGTGNPDGPNLLGASLTATLLDITYTPISEETEQEIEEANEQLEEAQLELDTKIKELEEINLTQLEELQFETPILEEIKIEEIKMEELKIEFEETFKEILMEENLMPTFETALLEEEITEEEFFEEVGNIMEEELLPMPSMKEEEIAMTEPKMEEFKEEEIEEPKMEEMKEEEIANENEIATEENPQEEVKEEVKQEEVKEEETETESNANTETNTEAENTSEESMENEQEGEPSSEESTMDENTEAEGSETETNNEEAVDDEAAGDDRQENDEIDSVNVKVKRIIAKLEKTLKDVNDTVKAVQFVTLKGIQSGAADLSSYNVQLQDTVKLFDGNPDFFNQLNIEQEQIYKNKSLNAYTNNDPISIKQSELIRIDIEKKQLLLELKILREG